VAHIKKLPPNFLALYSRELALIGDQIGRFPIELDDGVFVTVENHQRATNIILRPATVGDAIRIRNASERGDR
jgi:hypothetical protein